MSARLEIRVHPGASRDQLGSWRQGVLSVRVTAPPLDGRANNAVRKLLAKRIGVAPSRVSVIRGESGRNKLLEIEGLTDEQLRERLG
ncbi:MAG: DUF167 domain-containing protein [Solirubrobacterales bacterium]|nr:DUF167 domain-containing protein [Solirubrobacterales bacterium]